MPTLEVSVTEPPAQKVVEPDDEMVAVGKGLTVTAVAILGFEHPLVETVTE